MTRTDLLAAIAGKEILDAIGTVVRALAVSRPICRRVARVQSQRMSNVSIDEQ